MRGILAFTCDFCDSGVLGTGFGIALGFFIFPFVFPPPEAPKN